MRHTIAGPHRLNPFFSRNIIETLDTYFPNHNRLYLDLASDCRHLRFLIDPKLTEARHRFGWRAGLLLRCYHFWKP